MADQSEATNARPVSSVPVRSSKQIGDGGSPSPHLAARNLRADRYLDLSRTLTNYRLLALVLLIVDLALVGVIVWQSHQTRIVPYVVQTDGYGNALAFGPADELPDPDRALKVHELARWVRNVRTVTLDRQVQRRLVLDAYAYTDRRAVARLNDWYRANAPFQRADRGTVSVQVSSVLALSDAEKTWQLQWLEIERDLSGVVREESRWQALITLDIDSPERVEQVVTNPLGLRVVDFDWTRLPETTTPSTGDSP